MSRMRDAGGERARERESGPERRVCPDGESERASVYLLGGGGGGGGGGGVHISTWGLRARMCL